MHHTLTGSRHRSGQFQQLSVPDPADSQKFSIPMNEVRLSRFQDSGRAVACSAELATLIKGT